jgi:glycosyltransferase involved in cell wall biosynthesis
MKPKVSIVMPVLNGEKYIREAIESILAQTYSSYELIVVDDGSNDGTRQTVDDLSHRLQVQYIFHPVSLGIAPSMNDGVRHASGEFIAFLDHDDAWFPNFLETQMSYLESHPETGMVHSDFQTTDVAGNILEASVAKSRKRNRPSGNVFPQLFMDSFIVGNSVLIRKECFARLGVFDESLRWGDYHMWLRISRHYRVDYVSQVLTMYRQHPAQSTRTNPGRATTVDSVGLQAIQKILELYPEVRQELGETLIDRRLASLWFDSAYSWWSQGASQNARLCLSKSIHLAPLNPRSYILYALSMLRREDAMATRKIWRRVRNAMSGATGEWSW